MNLIAVLLIGTVILWLVGLVQYLVLWKDWTK
jgi:hypothetical protein